MKKVQVHIPYLVLIERFDEILRAGINPEIYLDGYTLDGADPGDLEKIRDEFARQDLTVTLHGPYMDLSPGGADESIRLATVERYRQVFRVVSCLRPLTVVLHAGYDERRFDGDRDLWLRQSLKTWPEFVDLAEESGTVIAVENVFEEEPGTIRDLIEELGSPFFRSCMDAGHLNLFSKATFEEWFKAIGHLVAEVHLHDNFGRRDNHLPVGEGSIDFPLFFRLLGKYSDDPVHTIEVHGEEGVFRGLEAVRGFIEDA